MDPNGEEILIYGEKYIPGEKCNSSDPNVQKAWLNLNEIYKTDAGKDVINAMCAKDAPEFNITNEKGKYENAANTEQKDGKINMFLNGQIGNIKYLSHELFHGFQYKEKQGGLSCHNEVEAQLFSFLVCGEQDLSPRNGEVSDKYMNSFINLLNGNFSSEDFGNLRDGFLEYSFANAPDSNGQEGIYTRLNTPPGAENNFLLGKYFGK